LEMRNKASESSACSSNCMLTVLGI